MQELQEQPKEFEERVINIDRVARVVKGGRRFRFRAAVIIGDGKGRIGMAIAKAGDVTSAVAKAVTKAQKNIVEIPLYKHGTIQYPVSAKYAGAHVLLKPAGPGTGVIAGGAVRDGLEVLGVTDILAKSLGSSNKINTAYATLEALKQLKAYTQLHPAPEPKEVPKQNVGLAKSGKTKAAKEKV